jgi:hypothetical protein
MGMKQRPTQTVDTAGSSAVDGNGAATRTVAGKLVSYAEFDRRYPFVYDDEWTANTEWDAAGRGDLIFTVRVCSKLVHWAILLISIVLMQNGSGAFAVVEAKTILRGYSNLSERKVRRF